MRAVCVSKELCFRVCKVTAHSAGLASWYKGPKAILASPVVYTVVYLHTNTHIGKGQRGRVGPGRGNPMLCAPRLCCRPSGPDATTGLQGHLCGSVEHRRAASTPPGGGVRRGARIDLPGGSSAPCS